MRVKGNVNRDENPFVPKKPAASNGRSHFRPAIRENTNVLPRRSSKAAMCFHGGEEPGHTQLQLKRSTSVDVRNLLIARIFVGKLTRLVVVVVVGGSHIHQ